MVTCKQQSTWGKDTNKKLVIYICTFMREAQLALLSKLKLFRKPLDIDEHSTYYATTLAIRSSTKFSTPIMPSDMVRTVGTLVVSIQVRWKESRLVR